MSLMIPKQIYARNFLKYFLQMLVSLISSIDQTISVQTPGVNFINILQAAFTGEDPKSTVKL